jgi:RNA polymerase sigma factor (TIGR02999 family)
VIARKHIDGIASGILAGMSEVTLILEAIAAGESQAADELLPLVYDELRQLAAQRLAHEQPGQTLQATALVHEVFLRLVDVSQAQRWDSRGHFFAAAAKAMRRILIDQARRKKSVKHGGGRHRVDLDDACSLADDNTGRDLLDLDGALSKLAAESPVHSQLVELRFFAGLTMSEAAQAMGISLTTAERHWVYARAWLYEELHAAV